MSFLSTEKTIHDEFTDEELVEMEVERLKSEFNKGRRLNTNDTRTTKTNETNNVENSVDEYDDYSSSRYSCVRCYTIFENYNEMQSHFKRAVCANEMRIFQCYICSDNIFGFNNFIKHITECE